MYCSVPAVFRCINIALHSVLAMLLKYFTYQKSYLRFLLYSSFWLKNKTMFTHLLQIDI